MLAAVARVVFGLAAFAAGFESASSRRSSSATRFSSGSRLRIFLDMSSTRSRIPFIASTNLTPPNASAMRWNASSPCSASLVIMSFWAGPWPSWKDTAPAGTKPGADSYGWITTGSPPIVAAKSRFSVPFGTRMQPFETARPIDQGAFVPWMPIGPPCAQPVRTFENAETPSAAGP